MKRRSIRTGTLYVTLITVLASLGFGYMLWSSSLFIRGEINTGAVRAEFVSAFTDDDGRVDDAGRDSGDTGNCPIQAGGNSSCDPAASGPDPKPRWDKDVAICTAAVLADGTGLVTKKNVYPGYFCTSWFGVHNSGSVPVRIAKATVNGVGVVPSVPTPFDLNADGIDDVAIHLTGIDQCQQIDPSQRVLMDIDQEILQGAPQGSDLAYQVEVILQQWNEDCAPTALPGLTVTQVGLSPAQASAVAAGFGLTADQLVVEDGVATFVDPAALQALPMVPLTGDFPNEDNLPVRAEGFDFAAIAQIVPLDPKVAVERTSAALAEAGALPEGTRAIVEHTMFEAVDTGGKMVAEAAIDTQVYYGFTAAGIPILGPGAQIRAAYSPEGKVTALLHSAYQLGSGPATPVIPPSEAASQCAALYPKGANIRPSLVYYAPPLGLGAQTILPHYDCGGTVPAGVQTAVALQKLIPAVSDPALVPSVQLQASAEGGLVSAAALVSGGNPPYTYSWSSSSTDLSGIAETADSIQYKVMTKNPDIGLATETVRVEVTDANGIIAGASETLQISPAPGAAGGDIGILVGGVVDFGIERAVSDLCADNVNRYSNRMDDEAFKRFHWTGLNAWERDFKGSSDHNAYVDNVDETFYCGHGWGGGFTFESNHDDGSIVPADPLVTAGGDWGDLDLEWLALLSCQVLTAEHNGQRWWQRWGPPFDGLHLLLGFQTNAYDDPDFAERFADYQLGREFLGGLITWPALPVRSAWFQAAAEEQPGGVEAVVMGVIGRNGMSNYNDYFWGQGPTGPDIRGSDIVGYWWQMRTTP